jgi:hypothetical protein
MAADRKSKAEDAGEFADFMADISREIAQRVESLDAPHLPDEDDTPILMQPGIILDWEDVTDRMIEEMR